MNIAPSKIRGPTVFVKEERMSVDKVDSIEPEIAPAKKLFQKKEKITDVNKKREHYRIFLTKTQTGRKIIEQQKLEKAENVSYRGFIFSMDEL